MSTVTRAKLILLILGLSCVNTRVFYGQDRAMSRTTFFNRMDSLPAPSGKGSIAITTHFANFNNSWTLSPSRFTRLTLAYDANIFHLPIKTEVYLTTENDFAYRGSFFLVGFDKQKFRNSLIAKYRDSIPPVPAFNPNKDILSIVEEKKQALNNEIQNKQQIRESLYQQINKKEEQLRDSLNISSTEDSLEIQEKIDSLNREKEPARHLANQLMKLQSAVDSLNKIEEKLQREIKQKAPRSLKDSLRLFKKQRLYSEVPETVDEGAIIRDKLNKKSKEYFLFNLEEFSVGETAPVFSSLTLEGLIIRGIHAKYNPEILGVEIVAGTTLVDPWRIYSKPGTFPKFNSPIIGSRLMLNAGENTRIFLTGVGTDSIFSFRDREMKIRHLVGAFGLSQKIKKKLIVDVEVAHAFHRNISSEQAYAGGENISSLPMAADLKALYPIGENIELKGQVRQINPSYKSNGAPFLFTDIREYQIEYSQKIFRKQIVANVSAKTMRDNLLNIRPGTNHFSGVGISAQTVFQKIPNIFVSYQPYTLGNAHPDPLYRSYAQSRTFILLSTYGFQSENATGTISVSYVQSNVLLESIKLSQKVDYKVLSASSSCSFSDKLALSSVILYGFADSHVDSFNRKGASFYSSYKLSPVFSPACRFAFYQNTSNSYQANASIILSFILVRRFIFDMEGSIGKLENMWGYQRKNFSAVTLKTQYLF